MTVTHQPSGTISTRTWTGLGLEWPEYWAFTSPEEGPGAALKPATVRPDALHAVDNSGRILEMSDFKSVFDRRDTGYPFRRLRRCDPLDLVFEVYHLNFGPDFRTQLGLGDWGDEGASDVKERDTDNERP